MKKIDCPFCFAGGYTVNKKCKKCGVVSPVMDEKLVCINLDNTLERISVERADSLYLGTFKEEGDESLL